MKKKLLISLLTFVSLFFFLSSLFGKEINRAGIVPAASEFYAMADYLYAESMFAPPSHSRPWSIDEFTSILERIDRGSLSQAGMRTYDQLQRGLRNINDSFKFMEESDISAGLGFQVFLEGYAHTNTKQFDQEEDWPFGYNERAPAAKLWMELSLHSWLYTYLDLEYKKNRFGAIDDSDEDEADSSVIYGSEFNSNLFDVQFVDFETPYRAFQTFGGEGWNFSLGRDLLEWGNGETGNLILGSHADYHDHMRFVSYHDNFKYEISYVFLEHPDLLEVDDEVPSEGFKAFLGHRIEFRPLPQILISATENVMYQNTALNPQYLNPVYIFHNLNNRSMFNAIASLEFDIMLKKGIGLYYQLAIDQARAPLESNSQPNTFGHLGGLRLTVPAASGYFHGGIELVYTSPYLYLRDLVDFKAFRRQFVIGYGFKPVEKFLGYEYGSDAMVLNAVLGYDLPGKFRTGLELFYMRHGENTLQTVIGDGDGEENFDNSLVTPSGIVEGTIRGSFSAEYMHSRKLSLWGRYDLIHKTNIGNSVGEEGWDMQASLGVSYSLN